MDILRHYLVEEKVAMEMISGRCCRRRKEWHGMEGSGVIYLFLFFGILEK